ncbi:MAG: sulfite exporter TauE/SafE family protein [Planctomycetes bacterium]|nr:sulfite exporter TauE/SafE family protein [Planctomycetota bacterium]MCP4066654.1 sulfite exporter TauE/SafE family protein [Phycisphaeraceae bacterium]MCP4939957.1 sulfite exporter TauE/SafE family protein [Phycisphaeraceae bacterium]
MTETLVAVFVASLLGSLHCAGMCGGLVLFCCGIDSDRTTRRWPVHLTYHGGRLVAYGIAGGLLGALGGFLDLGGRLVGIQTVAGWFAAAVLIGMGTVMIARVLGMRRLRGRVPRRLQRIIDAGYARAAGERPWRRGLVVGLMSPLLPCGWLWAFLAIAAGSGGAVQGILVMVTFWSGTVPVLLAIGIGAHRISPMVRRFVPATMGVLLVAIGVLTAFTRLPHADAVVRGAIEVDVLGQASLADAVESVARETPACCAEPVEAE